jgi:hypothetical protein
MVACGHGKLAPKPGEITEIHAAAGADVNRCHTVTLTPESGSLPTFTALGVDMWVKSRTSYCAKSSRQGRKLWRKGTRCYQSSFVRRG